jgi:ribosomal protein S1
MTKLIFSKLNENQAVFEVYKNKIRKIENQKDALSLGEEIKRLKLDKDLKNKLLDLLIKEMEKKKIYAFSYHLNLDEGRIK